MDECSVVLEEFGIELPSEFDCSNFPAQYAEHPCVPIQSHKEELPRGTLRWVKTHESDENGEIRPEKMSPEYQCPTAQMISQSEFVSDSANQNPSFAGIENCGQPCEPIHLEKTETSIFRLILAVFSAFSAIISAFSILIFFRDRKR